MDVLKFTMIFLIVTTTGCNLFRSYDVAADDGTFDTADGFPTSDIDVETDNSDMGDTTPISDMTDTSDDAVDMGLSDIDLPDMAIPVVDWPMTTYTCSDTLYVNPTANAGGNGTMEAPIQLVTSALAVAIPGTCIQLSPHDHIVDEYDLSLTRGTPEFPIVVIGNSQATILSTATAFIGSPRFLIFDDVSFIGGFAFILSASHYTEFRNIRANGSFISTGFSSNVAIVDSTFSLTLDGYDAIRIASSTNILVRNSTFDNLNNQPGSTIGIFGGSRNAIVEGCIFSNSFNDGYSGIIGLGEPCSDDECSNPDNDQGYALYDAIVRNNYFENVNRPVQFAACNNCSFVHNTVFGFGTEVSAVKLNNAATFGIERSTIDTLISNNIFYANTATFDEGLFDNRVEITRDNLELSHNIFFYTGGPFSFGNLPTDGNANAITADPQLTGTGPTPWRPLAGSPAIGAASPGALLTNEDIEGLSRTQPTNIGASQPN